MSKSYIVIGKDLFQVEEGRHRFLLINDRFFLAFYEKPKYDYNTLMRHERVEIGLTLGNKFEAFRNFKKFYYLLKNKQLSIEIQLVHPSFLRVDNKYFTLIVNCHEEYCTSELKPISRKSILQKTRTLHNDWYEIVKFLVSNKKYIDLVNEGIKNGTIDVEAIFYGIFS